MEVGDRKKKVRTTIVFLYVHLLKYCSCLPLPFLRQVEIRHVPFQC